MKDGIVVVGAGGHAKVCIEQLRAAGHQVDFCIGQADSADHCLDVTVLKGDGFLSQLKADGYAKAFIAIGSNGLRLELARCVEDMGFELVNAISPHAVISPTVQLGRGIAIMPGAVVNADTKIFDLAIVNTGATVDHDCIIGRAVHIAPQCGLAGSVTVSDLSFLGIGCKVIPGVRIGERVTLGAGAVVISDIESGTKAWGVPAKRM